MCSHFKVNYFVKVCKSLQVSTVNFWIRLQEELAPRMPNFLINRRFFVYIWEWRGEEQSHGEKYLHRDSMKHEEFGSRVLHLITRLFRTLQRQIICNKLDIDATILIRTCVICKIKTTFLIRITCAIYVFHWWIVSNRNCAKKTSLTRSCSSQLFPFRI